jgi:hypothetical protein
MLPLRQREPVAFETRTPSCENGRICRDFAYFRENRRRATVGSWRSDNVEAPLWVNHRAYRTWPRSW